MTRIAGFFLLAALPLAANAHDRGENLPWNERDGWVLVGTDEEKGEMTFVALNHIKRVGSAAKVETLRVHRDIDERFGTDQAHYHLLVDCDDFSWTRISYRGYRPDGSGAHLLTREIGEREAPPSGSLFDQVFNLACATDAADGTVIPSPYEFAKSHFEG